MGANGWKEEKQKKQTMEVSKGTGVRHFWAVLHPWHYIPLIILVFINSLRVSFYISDQPFSASPAAATQYQGPE